MVEIVTILLSEKGEKQNRVYIRRGSSKRRWVTGWQEVGGTVEPSQWEYSRYYQEKYNNVS